MQYTTKEFKSYLRRNIASYVARVVTSLALVITGT